MAITGSTAAATATVPQPDWAHLILYFLIFTYNKARASSCFSYLRRSFLQRLRVEGRLDFRPHSGQRCHFAALRESVLYSENNDRHSLPLAQSTHPLEVVYFTLCDRDQFASLFKFEKWLRYRTGIIWRSDDPFYFFFPKKLAPGFRRLQTFRIDCPTSVWIAINEWHIQVVRMSEEYECFSLP